MMYQRDIVLSAFGRAQEAQQEFDQRREEGVDAEEEESEDQGHDDDHDRGRDGFLSGRPVDLGGLGADLTDEFAGGSLGHVLLARFTDIKRLRGRDWPAELTIT